MYTTVNEGKGVVKTNWENVRSYFRIVEPKLTELIDQVSPDNSLPIYLLYFPYGELKGDTSDSYLPLLTGGTIKLADPSLDKTLLNDLGYGMHSSPLGVILDKHIEYFIELNEQVFPYLISGPGSIFNKGILLSKKGHRNYTPNGVLQATSGSRTAFMLPSINSHNGINKLSKAVNQELTTPRKLNDHFELFKAINRGSSSNWRSCLAYFSKAWVDHMLKDPSWLEIKNYILEGKTNKDSFNANSTFFDIFYSKAQKDRNFRTSSPYLTNTAIHLIKVALGEYPAYIPTINEDLLPLSNIQNLISDSFQLKKTPTVMTPHSLIFENEKEPVYYSLQHPTTPHFLTKTNERVTANQEIDVIESILSKLLEEMSNKNSMLAGTVLADIPKNISFNYYHNYPPKNSNLIQNSRELCTSDPRFLYDYRNIKQDFCSEGQFLRGCVQIHPK